MCEPLFLANPDTNTLRPVRSRASTIRPATRTASHAFNASLLGRWSVVGGRWSVVGGRVIEQSLLKGLRGQLRGSWRDGYLLLHFLVSRLVGCLIISSDTALRVLAALLPGWVGDVIRHA